MDWETVLLSFFSALQVSCKLIKLSTQHILYVFPCTVIVTYGGRLDYFFENAHSSKDLCVYVSSPPVISRYRTIPVISPELIQLRNGFRVGL